MPHKEVCLRESAHWNDSLSGYFLWSNVNFGEAVTAVMTPLTWSVTQFTLDDWVFLPGTPTVGNIGGRPYLNISILATIYQVLGRSREDLLDTMEASLYMPLPADLAIPHVPLSPIDFVSGVFASTRVQWKQRRGVHRLPAYIGANKAWFEEVRRALASATTPAALHDLWHGAMKAHIKEGAWCVLGSAPHSADYTLQLRRDLADLVGAEDASILIANLSQEDRPLASLGWLLALETVARGDMSREAYLEEYGHRGPQEFELSHPRPAEDPTWLERELEKAARAPLAVDRLLADQRSAVEAAWQRLQDRSERAARQFHPRLQESSRRARLREQGRSAYVRDRWAIRLFALRAAELCGLGEDVFFLRLEELLALLAGEQPAVPAVEPRRETYRRYKALPPYPPVILGAFDPFAWAADPNRPVDLFADGYPTGAATQPAVVTGAPGSAGVVEGRARIITDPTNGDLLQRGEILVAVQTDVAWTLLFPRAAAVVTDVGAPLSHAAIVARELGIPAVVGCGNATSRLCTGDRVRVDGNKGIVQLVDGADGT